MYTSRAVSELVGLSVDQVRRFARAGFLSPERTPQNHYRFSFQDLTFLRTTTQLFYADLHRHRVHRALRELRRVHPTDRPLSEVRLMTTGDGIIAHDGTSVWNVESGQIVLDSPTERTHITLIYPDRSTRGRPTGKPPNSWFEYGCVLEPHRPAEARQAYRARWHSIRHITTPGSISPACCTPWDNPPRPSSTTASSSPWHRTTPRRHAISESPSRTRGRFQEAFTAYAQAIAVDPSYAEAHFNIAKLYEHAETTWRQCGICGRTGH